MAILFPTTILFFSVRDIFNSLGTEIVELEKFFICQEVDFTHTKVSLATYDTVTNKIGCGDAKNFDWKK